MSGHYLLSRRACPVCRRNHHDNTGDNLAIYDDGHEWCYRCGYYIPPKLTVEAVKNKLESPMKNANTTPSCDSLPHDISAVLGSPAITWLLKYGLTPEEMKKFWWSESEQQLIYPVNDVAGNMVFWQARNFRGYPNKKYYSSGNLKDHLHVLGTTGPLVLVEDAISAIKVARSCTSMPLFGSHITKELLLRLRNHVLAMAGPSSELIIWLDPDKSEEALRYGNVSRELGINALVILSLSDPKCYATFEIQNFMALAGSSFNATPSI